MNRKDKGSARKWLKKILAPFKHIYHPTSFELYQLFMIRPGSVEFTEKEFIEFCWSDDREISCHATCHGAKFCQVNTLERRYQNFITEFGPFNKNEYLHLRLALKF